MLRRCGPEELEDKGGGGPVSVCVCVCLCVRACMPALYELHVYVCCIYV